MKKLCMILPLALILCFMIGCQDKEAMAELESFRAQAEVEKQNIAHVKRLREELNKGNLDAFFMDMCSPDIEYFGNSWSSKPLSLEDYRKLAESIFFAFPDIKMDDQDIIAKGDKVTSRWIFWGTHEGEYAGIPATGNKIEVSMLTIFRFQNGKITEIYETGDVFGLMQQLGMELKPKEGKK